jgi:hypothetical protein
MGFLKSAIKTGITLKVLDLARREASKPENQRKAKEMLGKISGRGSAGTTTEPIKPT